MAFSEATGTFLQAEAYFRKMPFFICGFSIFEKKSSLELKKIQKKKRFSRNDQTVKTMDQARKPLLWAFYFNFKIKMNSQHLNEVISFEKISRKMLLRFIGISEKSHQWKLIAMKRPEGYKFEFKIQVRTFCSKLNFFAWIMSSQLSHTALIWSALENTDLGASNGGSNVRIRPFGVDLITFEMTRLPCKLGLKLAKILTKKSYYLATQPF